MTLVVQFIQPWTAMNQPWRSHEVCYWESMCFFGEREGGKGTCSLGCRCLPVTVANEGFVAIPY